MCGVYDYNRPDWLIPLQSVGRRIHVDVEIRRIQAHETWKRHADDRNDEKACAYDIQNACGADMRAAGDIGGLVSLMDNLRIEKAVAGDGYRRRSLVFQAIVATDCRTRGFRLYEYGLGRRTKHAATGGP